MSSSGTSRAVTTAIVVLSAAYLVVFGVWMWTWPQSFAEFVDFPNHEHFLHDLGAYHFGFAVALLAALLWRDAIFVVLTGFASLNVVHTVNHAMDLHLGGDASDPYAIGVLALAGVLGMVLRARHLRAAATKEAAR